MPDQGEAFPGGMNRGKVRLSQQCKVVIVRVHQVLSCCSGSIVKTECFTFQSTRWLDNELGVTCKLTYVTYANVLLFQWQNRATLLDVQACLLLMNPNQSMSVYMKCVLFENTRPAYCTDTGRA